MAARISPASTSTIRIPLIRWPASWQPWHASRLWIGMTVRRSVPSRVSITRLEARCCRREPVAGLARRRRQGEVGARGERGAGVAGTPLAVEEHHVLDAWLGAEALDHRGDQAPVVLHHLVLERDPDEVSLREGRLAGRPDQRVEVVDGVEVRARRAGDRDGRRDASGKAERHAGQAKPHFPVRPAWCARAFGPVNDPDRMSGRN